MERINMGALEPEAMREMEEKQLLMEEFQRSQEKNQDLREIRNRIIGGKLQVEDQTKEILARAAQEELKVIGDFHIQGSVLRKYIGNGGDVVIPDNIVVIGEQAFNRCENVTGIIIPGSVKSIEEWAFCKCIGLTSINIPSSVEIIGKAAFEDCKKLVDVTIPLSITCIEESLFGDCRSLKEIIIPASVRVIRSKAFKWSGLERITILSPQIDIAVKSFEWCAIKEVRLYRHTRIDRKLFDGTVEFTYID